MCESFSRLSVLFWHLSIFVRTPHFLIYCRYKINLDVLWSKSTNSVIYFTVCRSYSWSIVSYNYFAQTTEATIKIDWNFVVESTETVEQTEEILYLCFCQSINVVWHSSIYDFFNFCQQCFIVFLKKFCTIFIRLAHRFWHFVCYCKWYKKFIFYYSIVSFKMKF